MIQSEGFGWNLIWIRLCFFFVRKKIRLHILINPLFCKHFFILANQVKLNKQKGEKMRSDYNILSFSRTSFLLFSSFFSFLFSFLFFSLIWMIHKIFHVLLLPYHTMAFLLLFIFILWTFCLILYVFKNS